MKMRVVLAGSKVFNKVDGKYYLIDSVDKSIPAGNAIEIDGEDVPVEQGKVITITAENALAFRFVKGPENEEVPKYELDENGYLFDEYDEPVNQGELRFNEVVKAFPGKILLSGQRNDEDNELRFYIYRPSKDRFYEVASVSEEHRGQVRVIYEDEKSILLGYEFDSEEDVIDEETGEVTGKKTVFGGGRLIYITKTTTNEADLVRRLDLDSSMVLGNIIFFKSDDIVEEGDEKLVSYVSYRLKDLRIMDAVETKKDATISQCYFEGASTFAYATDSLFIYKGIDRAVSVKTPYAKELRPLKLIDVSEDGNIQKYSFTSNDLVPIRVLTIENTYDRGQIVSLA